MSETIAIHAALIEAYIGTYEDDFDKFLGAPKTLRQQAIEMILSDEPRKRLEVYLQWNGIIGYSYAIFCIANGGL